MSRHSRFPTDQANEIYDILARRGKSPSYDRERFVSELSSHGSQARATIKPGDTPVIVHLTRKCWLVLPGEGVRDSARVERALTSINECLGMAFLKFN